MSLRGTKRSQYTICHCQLYDLSLRNILFVIARHDAIAIYYLSLPDLLFVIARHEAIAKSLRRRVPAVLIQSDREQ
ncbi:MAG: hypothetical protein ACRC62_23765 [Microcoleus sp.]